MCKLGLVKIALSFSESDFRRSYSWERDISTVMVRAMIVPGCRNVSDVTVTYTDIHNHKCLSRLTIDIVEEPMFFVSLANV